MPYFDLQGSQTLKDLANSYQTRKIKHVKCIYEKKAYKFEKKLKCLDKNVDEMWMNE